MTLETVVCIGALVRDGDRLLSIRQSKGHSLEGQWTIPWGMLEKGESPSEAVLREVHEETGIVASVDGLLGVQEMPDPWHGWLAILYLCSHVDGSPRPDEKETDAAEYLSLEQIKALNEPIEAWSEWLMCRVLENDYTLTVSKPTNPYESTVGFV